MTRYRTVDVGQEPTDIGADTAKRVRYIINIGAVKSPSDTFAEEILQRLEDEGVGTRDVDLFWSSKAAIPTGDGPYLNLVETGGTTPERTQNEVRPPAYPRPSAQITCRAKSSKAARAMARAAYNALVGLRNIELTP